MVCACDKGFEGDGYACVASSATSSEAAQLPQLSVDFDELLAVLTAIVGFVCWMVYRRARLRDARKVEHMAPAAQVVPLVAAPHEAGPPGAQVIWSAIGRLAWDGGGLGSTDATIPSYCDSELTDALHPSVIRAFLAQLVSTAAALGEWRQTSTRVDTLANGCGAGPATVVTWQAAGLNTVPLAEDQSGRGRIEVWRGTSGVDDDGLAVLELEGRVALIVGCALGHPYVSCNLCYFGNSDGSSTWDGHSINECTPPGNVTALITKMAEVYMLEQIH